MNVSAIIPFYNTPIQWTESAINSIQQQTVGCDLELIVVDDCSSPGFQRPLKEFMKTLSDPSTLLRLPRNAGRSAAVNRGVEIAQGSHVLLLDADDMVVDGGIQKAINVIGDNALAFSDHTKYSTDLSTPIYVRKKASAMHYHAMFKGTVNDPLWHMSFPGHIQLINKDAYEAIDGFNSQVKLGEDLDFLQRLAELSKDVNFVHIPESLHIYRMAPGSVSNCGKWKSQPVAVIEDMLRRNGVQASVLPGRKLGPYENTFFDFVKDGRVARVPYVDYRADTLIGLGNDETEIKEKPAYVA